MLLLIIVEWWVCAGLCSIFVHFGHWQL